MLSTSASTFALANVNSKSNDRANKIPDERFTTSAKIFMKNSEMRLLLCVTIAKHPVNLLLDTGAQASVLRGRVIHPDAMYFPRASTVLTGVTSHNGYKSVGLTFGAIIVNDINFQHQFQIVSDDFHLDADGIIGCDFLVRYNCTIDVAAGVLKISIPINHPYHEPNTCCDLESSSLLRANDTTTSETGLVKRNVPSNKGRMGLEDADGIEVLSSEEIPATAQRPTAISVTKIAEDLSDVNDITQYLDDLDVADDNSRELVNIADRYNAICASTDLSHCNDEEQRVSRQLLREFTQL